MAYGITNLFEKNLNLKQPRVKDNELLFTVREPFKSIRTQIDITKGIISENQNLILESYMPTNGIIFSDGIEKDFLKFNSGAIATIGLSDEKTNLIMNENAS